MGPKPILKECFVQTSNGTLSAVMIYNWKTQYAVLTKNGALYILRNMYDTPAEAEARFDLAKGNVFVNGDLKSFSIELICNDERKFLRLPNTEEFASWLRSLGEFGTRGTSAGIASQKEASQNASQNAAGSASSPSAPVPDRQGTKTDQLSSMYGI